MKKVFVLYILILNIISPIYANTNQRIELNIETPGTLKNFIKNPNDFTAKGLTLSGRINYSDLKCISEDFSQLEYLNLKNVVITRYVDSTEYYRSTRYIYIPNCFDGLYKNESIKTLILPQSINSINSYALADLKNLNNLKVPMNNKIRGFYFYKELDQNISERSGKILMPPSLSSISIYTDSSEVIFQNSKGFDSKFNVSDLNYNECLLVSNAINFIKKTDFPINNIDGIRNGFKRIGIKKEDFFDDSGDFYYTEAKMRLLELNSKNLDYDSRNNLKISTISQLKEIGYNIIKDDYIPDIKTLISNNIWNYFGHLKELNSPLKKSIHLKSNEYKIEDSVFQKSRSILKNCIKYFKLSKDISVLNSDFYNFHEGPIYEISDYNMKSKSFQIVFNRTDRQSINYPKNFFYAQGDYFLIPCIPTVITSKLVSPGNIYDPTRLYDFETKFEISVNPDEAIKIEENKSEIDIYFVFTDLDISQYKSKFGSSSKENIAYIVKKTRMLLVNKNTHEIYFSKLFTPVQKKH